jgi:hypothetical protein
VLLRLLEVVVPLVGTGLAGDSDNSSLGVGANSNLRESGGKSNFTRDVKY